MCSCGRGLHDAYHLFMHCSRLSAVRQHLEEAIPGAKFTFDDLVTRHGRIAAEFAIRYFEIKQFEWTAKHMLNHSFGNLPELPKDKKVYPFSR